MKKLISVLCALLLTAMTLASCAKDKGTTPNGNSNTDKPKEKAVVTLIQNKVEIQQQLEAAAKDFNDSQSDVEIKVLGSLGDNLIPTIQSQFASDPKTAPVIFTCQSGSEFDNFFEFMAPMDSSKAISHMVESQIEDSKKDGTTYGLPLAVEGFGLVYNKAIFEKAGVDPASLKTMDDLVNAAKNIQKVEGVSKALAFSKETYFTFMQPFNWPFAVMSNYKDAIAKVGKGEIKLKDIPEVKQYAEGLSKLMPYTNLALDSYDDAVAGFAQGKYAMVHQGNWAQGVLDNYKDTIKFEYGMLPMPINGNGIAVGNTNYFHVNKYATEEQQKGAITFMDWLLTDPAGQKYVTDEFKLIPAYSNFDISNLSPLSKDVSKYSSEGKTVPWTFGLFPSGMDKDGTTAMQKFYAGKSTVDQLLDELDAYFVNAASN